MLLPLGCCEHGSTGICVMPSGYIAGRGIAGSYGNPRLNFLMSCQAVLHSSCTVLPSHQWQTSFQLLLSLPILVTFWWFFFLFCFAVFCVFRDSPSHGCEVLPALSNAGQRNGSHPFCHVPGAKVRLQASSHWTQGWIHVQAWEKCQWLSLEPVHCIE